MMRAGVTNRMLLCIWSQFPRNISIRDQEIPSTALSTHYQWRVGGARRERMLGDTEEDLLCIIVYFIEKNRSPDTQPTVRFFVHPSTHTHNTHPLPPEFLQSQASIKSLFCCFLSQQRSENILILTGIMCCVNTPYHRWQYLHPRNIDCPWHISLSCQHHHSHSHDNTVW